MSQMVFVLYDIATSLAAPLGAAWLALHRDHRALLGRFAPRAPSFDRRPIWIQACSVGEVTVAKPLIGAMRKRWPDTPIVLTTSTVRGYAHAEESCPEARVAWFPVDHRAVVRRFVRALQPRVLVLIETELWPSVLREARAHGVPAVIVNGRLSDKHYKRYLRYRAFFRPVLECVSAAGMQNAEYAERIAAVGLEASRIQVTGNTKFDGVRTAIPAEEMARVRAENGFSGRPDDAVLVFGSTRPGDEALAAQCWRELRGANPTLRLVIAPRHIERLNEAMAPFDEPILRRSEVKQGRVPGAERVFVLDTVGELVSFYAIATVAVVGGSFYGGVEGHNPLEPAALGVPTVFGPYMRNFIDPARVLVESGGCRQVASPDELAPVLRRLLADAVERAEVARRGREAIVANQGGIARSLDLIESLFTQ